MKLLCSSIFAVLALTCSVFGIEIQTNNLRFLNDSEQEVEIFISKPGKTQAPLLIFLHGVMTDKGIKSIPENFFEYWLNKGYAVAAVSMPGFGKTQGNKDFCGPATLQVLNFAIDTIKTTEQIQDFGVIGLGQGGIAALLLAANRNDVICVVCANGMFDLLSHFTSGDPFYDALVTKNYTFDITAEQFRIRSPLEHVNSIKSNIFIIHREEHHYLSTHEVFRFVEAFREVGGKCEFSLLPKIPNKKANVSYDEIISASGIWVDSQMRLFD